MDNYIYKVCTQCITYNHVSYIRDSLNGFVKQRTTFPYVTAIIDDASTDGNANVILQYFNSNFRIKEQGIAYYKETEYANIYFARHNSNDNCYFALVLLKYNHHSMGLYEQKKQYLAEWIDNSEYLAICEGDDYWVDPLKLHKQVIFMDANPDYSLCCTDFDLVTGKRNHRVSIPKDGICFPHSVLHELEIGTATAIYRNSVFKKLPQNWRVKKWLMEDTPMWIELSHDGKVKYMPIVTARYRILTNSASHGNIEKEIKFIKSSIEIHQFYSCYYNIELPNNGYDKNYYIALVKIAYKHHNKQYAHGIIKDAKKNNGVSLKFLVFYLCAVVPLFGRLMHLLMK